MEMILTLVNYSSHEALIGVSWEEWVASENKNKMFRAA